MEGPRIFSEWFDRQQIKYMNPWTVKLAPHLPGFAQVVHKGRKSGTTYRTPVNPIQTKGRFVVTLGHGTYTDWVRNILAQESATVIIRGQEREITNIRIVPAGVHGKDLPFIAQVLNKRIAILTADIH